MGVQAVTGSIQKRGDSWRLKYEGDRDAAGKRKTCYATVRGSKRQAQAELIRLLAARDTGAAVEIDKVSLATYLRGWLATAEAFAISRKTAERYKELIGYQIIPHLGTVPLQKLKGSHIAEWHAKLLNAGGRRGEPLSALTVRHCHRLLHKALGDAMRRELVTRNAANLTAPPRVARKKMRILDAEQITIMLDKMQGTPIYPQIVVLLSTGMRRGELFGLQWRDGDLDGGKLRVERAVETTRAGLRIKVPKTASGRRLIALPEAAVSVLRQHRKAVLETRIALGLGKLPDDAFIIGDIAGKARDPDGLTWSWRRLLAARGLPPVTLHSLRHSHASALIAAGMDIVTVSKRLGHGGPAITLGVYSHLFNKGDEAAAKMMDAVFDGLGANRVPKP
jgi:integrase